MTKEPEEDGYHRDWLRPRPFYFDWPVSRSAFRHCCAYMDGVLAFSCDQHASPFECPDNSFIYHEVFDEYGVINHNPERTYTLLQVCPFCGTKLPPSRQDDWDRALAALGFDPFGDAIDAVLERTGSYTQAWHALGIPERYLTADWRSP